MASNAPPPSSKKEWTKEKNERFETALTIYGDGVHENWENIAMFVGDTTEEEVKKYYEWLVEDIERIEADLVPIPNYMDDAECSQTSNNEDAHCSQVDITTQDNKGDLNMQGPTKDE